MLSGAGSGRCRVSWALGLMLSRLGPDQCRVELARANVESLGPRSMSSGASLGRCRVDWALANVESSGLGPLSSPPGIGRCRVVWAWVGVESTGSWLMSSRLNPGRCRVVRARTQADVELSELGLLSNRVSPCSDWVDLGPVRAKLVCVHIKMNLI